MSFFIAENGQFDNNIEQYNLIEYYKNGNLKDYSISSILTIY